MASYSNKVRFAKDERPPDSGRSTGYYQRAHRHQPTGKSEHAPGGFAATQGLLLRLEVNEEVLQVPQGVDCSGLMQLLDGFIDRLELSFTLSLTLRLRVLLDIQHRYPGLVAHRLLNDLLDLYKEKVMSRRKSAHHLP